jgi:hypothetical protein
VTFLSEDRQYISTASLDLIPTATVERCAADRHCSIGILTAPVPAAARFAVIHTPTIRVGVRQVTPLPGKSADQTYMIGKSFVTLGGGTPVVRTIGMSTGEVEVLPLY